MGGPTGPGRRLGGPQAGLERLVGGTALLGLPRGLYGTLDVVLCREELELTERAGGCGFGLGAVTGRAAGTQESGTAAERTGFVSDVSGTGSEGGGSV